MSENQRVLQDTRVPIYSITIWPARQLAELQALVDVRLQIEWHLTGGVWLKDTKAGLTPSGGGTQPSNGCATGSPRLRGRVGTLDR